MKFFKEWLLPLISKFYRYILRIMKATAREIATKIPAGIAVEASGIIKYLAQNKDLSGSEKMKEAKRQVVDLLGSTFDNIGNSLLDTFLQNLYQGMKIRMEI